MVEINNIRIKYKEHVVIDDFSLTIGEGELIALTGESGSGKSSILYAIAMLKDIDCGEIIINGKKNPTMNSKEGKKIYAEELAFVFQDFLLLKDKTVAENLELVQQNMGSTVDDALDFVGMKKFKNNRVSELSGGQQQRIAIARLFMKPFNIVLGDEITGSLDKKNRDIIMDLMIELKNMGKCILLVTHDLQIADMCDRKVVIK